MFLNFLRKACLLALLLNDSATPLAQAASDDAPDSLPMKTVSASQPADGVDQKNSQQNSTQQKSTQTPASEPFRLPVKQHAWARFQPGAWRELQTVTETFGETGQVVGRNVTTQTEVLQTVAEGKYILQVQATVDLGGRRIVGERKNRVLTFATDRAGSIVDSRRLKDQSLPWMGRTMECQVFEIRYHEGARNLTDRIHYNSQQFPFVLQRETFLENNQADNSQAENSPPEEGNNKEASVIAEQLAEVETRERTYWVGKQLFKCSCQRTVRHRKKGDTHRLAFTHRAVPGGEVVVRTTDFDAQGKRTRMSVTSLRAFGKTPPDALVEP